MIDVSDPGVVRIGDREIIFPRKSFLILKMLVEANGRGVTEDTIIDEIWDNRLMGSSNFVRVHISKIRKKLEGTGYTIGTRLGFACWYLKPDAQISA